VGPIVSDRSFHPGLPVRGRLPPGAPRVTGVLSVGGLKPPTPSDTALRLVRLLSPLGELTADLAPPASGRHSPPPLFPRRSSPSVAPPSSLSVDGAGAHEAVASFLPSGEWTAVVAVASSSSLYLCAPPASPVRLSHAGCRAAAPPYVVEAPWRVASPPPSLW
jgi:hypothetical protein